MPFKSKAQLRKFGEMVKQGTMKKEEFKKWVVDTPNIQDLPERAGQQKAKVGVVKKVKSL